MRTKVLSLFVLASIVLAACAGAATPAPATEASVPPTPVTIIREVVVTPTPGPNPEAVIQGVEPNAEITFWTFWLSPTFDDFINGTIARFQQAYPGVTVKWEDHQGTFLDDYRNSVAAGTQPDVANLSNGEGWVSEFATKGVLLNLDDAVPQSVKDVYFPGLWRVSLVDGKNYQFPWYAAVAVELINTQLYTQAGLKVEEFPKTVAGLPALCKTIKAMTGTLCDIRLTVNDLPSQMIYEGGVKFISDDGKKFTFDSPEAVTWLQMYVDMVKAGVVDRTALMTDQDRVALDLFTTGKAAFFQTGPQLIREVRTNNPGLYGYLAVVPAPLGASGAMPPTAMAISVKKDTPFPNASIALAQFFTNPRSMLEFSKVVSIYPSTPASYDDPFFSAKPVAIEDSAKPIAKDIISRQTDLKPTIPSFKDVNEILLQAIQQALFNNVPAQQALTDAVTKANALIK
ncbi:MAG TPA: sugar ABC transporter substrate-binding protein [Anaerolineales bacterium]|nr:sugar ABC transporter substrate-binding protein [Anaerolineales bacterium]